MRTRDYKVVRYIKHHPGITKESLYKKFNFLNAETYKYIKDYIDIEHPEPELNDNGNPTGNWVVGESSTFSINHFGEEILEKRRHDKWLFWFPYIVTTIIALISAAPTIYKIINYFCRIFSSGIYP